MTLIPLTLPAGIYRNGTEFQASKRWQNASGGACHGGGRQSGDGGDGVVVIIYEVT
jgi:hypothetical protein